MQDVLEFILKNITTTPDDVTVSTSEEDGVTNYTISVNPDDVGRVIGKEGKVIKAIRTIMRVIAIQKGVRIRVTVLSDVEENSDNGQDDDTVTIEEAPPAQSSSEPTDNASTEEPEPLTVEV